MRDCIRRSGLTLRCGRQGLHGLLPVRCAHWSYPIEGPCCRTCSLGGTAMAVSQADLCDVNTVLGHSAIDKGGHVASIAQRLALAFVVATAACAHAGPSRSPAPSGSYRFSGALPGLADVTGSFDISPNGRLERFIGTCRTMETPSHSATSTGCSVQPRSIAGRDDSTVLVTVRVLATETTQSPSDPTRLDGQRSVRLRLVGTLSAERSGR